MSGVIFLTKGLIVPGGGNLMSSPYAKKITVTKKPSVKASVQNSSISVSSLKTNLKIKSSKRFGAKVRQKKNIAKLKK